MKNKFTQIIRKLIAPPIWLAVLICISAVITISLSFACLIVHYDGILSYIIYALAALTLAHTVYMTVRLAPRTKRGVIAILERREFTNNLLRSFGFRTLIFATGSLILNIAYGIFNGVIALMSLSVWYGALAAYYILLTVMRGTILIYHNRKRKGKYEEKTEAELKIRRAKTYRSSGILLILLHLALPAAIAGMVLSDKAFAYPGLMIYATAAYAFYKITMSIYNIFKARRQDDLTVQAVRNINLADALVSIFALQTALLETFGSSDLKVDFMNLMTGAAVSLITLTLGVMMSVYGNRKIKEYKATETLNAKQ